MEVSKRRRRHHGRAGGGDAGLGVTGSGESGCLSRVEAALEVRMRRRKKDVSRGGIVNKLTGIRPENAGAPLGDGADGGARGGGSWRDATNAAAAVVDGRKTR